MFDKKKLDEAFEEARSNSSTHVVVETEIPNSESPTTAEYQSFFKDVKPASQAINSTLRKAALENEFIGKICPENFENIDKKNRPLAKFGKVGNGRQKIKQKIIIEELSTGQHEYYKALLEAFEQNDFRRLLARLKGKFNISEHFLPFIAILLDPDYKKSLGQPPKFNSYTTNEVYLEVAKLILIENLSFTQASERVGNKYGITREKLQKYYRSVEVEMVKKFPWTKRN